MLATTIERAEGASPWKRLGTIRLGIKAKNAAGKEYPKDVDYFVIPEVYRAKLGDQPRELRISLANPGLQSNFDTRAAMYRANGSKACFTTNDREAHRFQKTGKVDPVTKKESYAWTLLPCPNIECDFRKGEKAQCKERGYFSFMIPAVEEIGVFTLKVGSSVGITHIYTALKAVAALTQNRALGMCGIRMVLRREATEFYRDIKGDGQLAKITKWIVNLDLDWSSLAEPDRLLLAPALGRPQGLAAPKPAVVDSVPATELDEEDDDEGPLLPLGDLPPDWKAGEEA